MPYVPGARAHGVVHIADVYRSGNVYANNVPVALWLSPGSSASFAGVDVDIAVNIPPNAETETAQQTNTLVAAQIAAPTAPNQYYKAEAVADGVKGNYAPVDDQTVSTGTVSTSTNAANIVTFLQRTMEEAGRGMWRETGQAGGVSNKNITGIWTSLGYPNSGPWVSDQTAWCMGFVNFALKCSGYKYVQTASAAAITTTPERWGAVQIPKDQAQPGDIAFWSYRHVNFVYTANNGKFSFVGGNQSPKASNNPNDGDVTNSWPSGTTASNPNWVSCWRITK
jgi:hypothetical protein